MHANSILALTGVVGLVSAIPFAGQPHHQHHHHHQHHRRDLVWKTVTEEVIQTIPVTRTVWLDPGETPPVAANQYSTPQSSAPSAPVYTPPASPVAPASYSAPAESSPVSSSVPAYTPPSSSYVAPVPASTYVAPPAPVAPSSSYVAPAPSSSAPSSPPPPPPSTGGSGSGLSSGMAKSGTYYTGDLTWYEVGLGACGISSTSDQHVVAISHEIFDAYASGSDPNANPLCNQKVTITGHDGSTYPATIVDRCVGCEPADLDLSQDLFNLVTDNGDGRVPGMKWCFD